MLNVHGNAVCAHVTTFKGKQCPLQRVECCSLISSIDLLEEAVCVMAPQGAGKAVDARRQLPTYTLKEYRRFHKDNLMPSLNRHLRPVFPTHEIKHKCISTPDFHESE